MRELGLVDRVELVRTNPSQDVASAACVCAIGYIDFRIPEHGFVERRKNIRAWFDNISKRPSVAATVPKLA